jgi:hypothetical protein
MDTDPTRRQLYGRAGACRYKTYGVEYRVLSNFWCTSRDKRLAVWNRLQLAINSMAKKFLPEDVPVRLQQLLQDGINNSSLDPQLVSNFKYPLVEQSPPPPVIANRRYATKPLNY